MTLKKLPYEYDWFINEDGLYGFNNDEGKFQLSEPTQIGYKQNLEVLRNKSDFRIWDEIIKGMRVGETIIQTEKWGWIPENIYKQRMEEIHGYVKVLIQVQKIQAENNLLPNQGGHLSTIKDWLIEQIPSGMYVGEEYMVMVDSKGKIITCNRQI